MRVLRRSTKQRQRRCLTTGHHLEKHAAKIFGLRKRRQDGMIECLLVTPQPPGGAARIDQRVGDHLLENLRADVMRAGKSREHSVRRKQLESADVQFLVTAQRRRAVRLCFS